MKNWKKFALVILCLAVILTVYAGCMRSYKVNYYDNGTLITTQTVNSGKTTKAPIEPTKEGYVFEGWYQNQSLTKKFDFNSKITQDTAVYAKFITANATQDNDY